MKAPRWLRKTGRIVAWPVTAPVDALSKRAGAKAVDGAVEHIAAKAAPKETGMKVKNWKTSLFGVAGVVAIVAKVVNGGSLDGEDFAIISGLIGLLFSKDKDVTGAGPAATRMP